LVVVAQQVSVLMLRLRRLQPPPQPQKPVLEPVEQLLLPLPVLQNTMGFLLLVVPVAAGTPKVWQPFLNLALLVGSSRSDRHLLRLRPILTTRT